MAAETLVESDIEGGLNLVRMLDDAGVRIDAALWIFGSDEERWRFLLAKVNGEKEISKNYLEVAELTARYLDKHPDANILSLDRVKITGLNDPLVKGLGPIMRLEGLGNVRFSHNVVNGIYLEDAIIHRMAA